MILPYKLIFITTFVVNYSLKVASTHLSIGNKKHNLKTTLRQLYSADRGYQSQSHIENIETMTVPVLKYSIMRAYMDIQCSYIFSAQIYMRLIEELLINKEQLEKVPQDIDISFTKEAAQMMATLYNVEEMRNTFTMNVMWIVLLFAERVLVYMKSIIKSDQAKDQKSIISVYNSVNSLLEHYMASDDCVDYSRVIKLDVKVTSNFDGLEGLLTTLEFKKSLIKQRLDTNDKHSISTAGYERFSLNVLSLNGLFTDIEATKRILESSGVEVDWKNILLHLKKEYDEEEQATDIKLSQHIIWLTKLNNKFIYMVKVIMIRLMFKYVLYIQSNRFKAIMHILPIHEYKTKIVNDIYVLENYLDIQDDEHIEYVKHLITNMHTFIDVNFTVDRIKDFLNQFSLQLYDAQVWHTFNAPEMSQDLILPGCEHIKQDIERFMKNFKDNAFFNINFSVIKTFNLLIQSIEYEKLVVLEK